MSMSDRDLRALESCDESALAQLLGLADEDEDSAWWLQTPDQGEAGPPPAIDGYRLIEPIGQGGMGVVWRAVQESTQREVALKVLRTQGLLTAEAQRRFEQEVRLAARMEHPYVARVYDSGVHRLDFFYSMELVEGEPLTDWVRREAVGEAGVVDVLIRVCEAVEYAHDRGVIHRDIKPSNVLVRPDGTPRVLDFGLALVAEDAAASGVGGTLMYMAPEQAGGGACGPASDVYALGMLLLEALTDAPPRDLPDDRAGARDAVRTRPPEGLSRLDAGRDLRAIVAKAVSVEPGARYATAAELADDLRRYRRGAAVHAVGAGPAYRLRRAVGRRRWLALGLVVGLLLAVVAAVPLATAYQSRGRDAQASARHAAEAGYALNLQEAAHRLTTGDYAGARTALDSSPAAMRGWEWQRLQAQLDRSAATIRGDTAPILAADGDPATGRMLLVARDGRVSALAAHRSLQTVAELPLEPVAAAAHAGRARVVVLTPDRALEVWDAAGPWRMRRIDDGGLPVSLAFRPDGDAVAVRWDDGRLGVYACDEAVSASDRIVAEEANAAGLAWSADGAHLAFGGEWVRLLDVSGPSPVERFSVEKPASLMAVGAEGLLVAAAADQKITLWDTRLRTQRWSVDRPTQAASLGFSAGGDALLVGGRDGALRLLGLRRGETTLTLPGHTSPVVDVAPAAGDWLVSRDATGDAKLWSARGEALEQRRLQPGPARGAAISPLGTRVAWISRSHLMLGPTRGTECIEVPLPSMPTSVAWSPEGNRVVVGMDNGAAQIRDGVTGEVVHDLPRQGAQVLAASFDPTGDRVAVATTGGSVTIYAAATGEPVRKVVGYGPFAWDAEGTRLYYQHHEGGEDASGSLRSLDLQTGEDAALASFEGASPVAFTLSPDGDTFAAAMDSGVVRVWDLRRGIARFETRIAPEGTAAWQVAFSADGRRLFASAQDVVVLSTLTGQPLLTMEVENGFGPTQTLRLLPDGRVQACNIQSLYEWTDE